MSHTWQGVCVVHMVFPFRVFHIESSTLDLLAVNLAVCAAAALLLHAACLFSCKSPWSGYSCCTCACYPSRLLLISRGLD